MIAIDILSYNLTNIILFSAPLIIFELNDRKIYFTLILDIIFNGIPFCTITILILYFLNKNLIKYFNNTKVYRFIISIIYLFLYSIVIFSIFNKFNTSVIKLVIKFLPINIILNAIVIFLKKGHTFN